MSPPVGEMPAGQRGQAPSVIPAKAGIHPAPSPEDGGGLG